MSKAHYIGKIIIITGPTASGKTTLIKIISARLKRLSFKSIVKVIEPYSGLSFILLYVVVKLITMLNSEYIKVAKKRGLMAFLEATRPHMLHKLLPLLTILDDVTLIIYTAVFKAVFALNVYKIILLEDFVPQAIADHFTYNYLYWGKNQAINLLMHEILLFNRLFNNCICIHMQTPEYKRILWAVKRGDLPTKSLGFYNEYSRGTLVRKLLNTLCRTVIDIKRTLHLDSTSRGSH